MQPSSTSKLVDVPWPWLFIAILQFGGALLGCSSDPCEEAETKIDECKAEIRKAIGADGYVSLPVAFSGECVGEDRCIANCIASANCNDLAAAMSQFGPDPNSPPNHGADRIYECVIACSR
jgi:hypothetical protein